MSIDKKDVLFGEIGLNHMGDLGELQRLAEQAVKCELNVSVQIREESFYAKFPEFFINFDEYKRIIEIVHQAGLKFGFAIGPIANDKIYKILSLKPDFIKCLNFCNKDASFTERYQNISDVQTYWSNGNWDDQCLPDTDLKLKKKDCIIHTVLSHNYSSQNLGVISKLKRGSHSVGYGLHCENSVAAHTAIGLGAQFLFFYYGNKNLKIPDKQHSICSSNLKYFSDQIVQAFESINKNKNVSPITFIG